MSDSINLEGFNTSEFPPPEGSLSACASGFVYVFCYLANGEEIPFYVGQTNRLPGRMRDYRLANFSACTDFCVGEAVRYLTSEKKYRVTLRYKQSDDPPKDEKLMIRLLMISGIWLVNCLPRYDYRTDDEAQERQLIHRFCDMFTNTQQESVNGV